MRAADADRERTAERLRDAAVEGRIRSEELEERLEAALAASTYAELDGLVADLPAPAAGAEAPAAAPSADLSGCLGPAPGHLGAHRSGLLLADLADPRLGRVGGSAARAGRLPNMPSERFVDELNAQIGRELQAAHQYTAVGAFYDRETFPRLAKFFYDQADEERGHAMKMVDYLRDTNSPMRLGEIKAPRTEFGDHVEPISLALEYEKKVTVSIGNLFQIARETDDYASESFMQWFVDEQVEEEATMDALLQVAERVREYPMMLEEFLARDGDDLGGD